MESLKIFVTDIFLKTKSVTPSNFRRRSRIYRFYSLVLKCLGKIGASMPLCSKVSNISFLKKKGQEIIVNFVVYYWGLFLKITDNEVL